MNWISLKEPVQLEEIKEKSMTRPQVIFKHSTRCSISQVVKTRLERNSTSPETSADFYFLDLINNRAVSNSVSETFHISHESPQILLIKNGECIYDESHMGIDMKEIMAQIAFN